MMSSAGVKTGTSAVRASNKREVTIMWEAGPMSYDVEVEEA